MVTNAKWCSNQRRENGQQRCRFYDACVRCVVRGYKGRSADTKNVLNGWEMGEVWGRKVGGTVPWPWRWRSGRRATTTQRAETYAGSLERSEQGQFSAKMFMSIRAVVVEIWAIEDPQKSEPIHLSTYPPPKTIPNPSETPWQAEGRNISPPVH